MAITKKAQSEWPDSDVEILRRFYPIEGLVGVQKRLSKKKSRSSIIGKAHRLGVKSASYIRADQAWSESDLNVLMEVYPVRGYIGVQEDLSSYKSKQAIVAKAMRMGIRSMAPRPGHGMMGTRTYNAWRAAKERVTNPNHMHHRLYRGLGMHEDWLSSFENFLSDMGEAPTDDHWIDRIDPEKGYEPGNCRWVTPIQSAANTRKRFDRVPFKGVSPLPSGRWRAVFFSNGKKHHIGVFDSAIDAAKAYDDAAMSEHGEYAMTNERAGLL